MCIRDSIKIIKLVVVARLVELNGAIALTLKSSSISVFIPNRLCASEGLGLTCIERWINVDKVEARVRKISEHREVVSQMNVRLYAHR